jgi:hypothetical protein
VASTVSGWALKGAMKKFVIFVVVIGALLLGLRLKYQHDQEGGPGPAPTVEPVPPAVPPAPPPVAVAPPTTTTLPRPPATGGDTGAARIVPGMLDLYATFSAVSVEFSYEGDANTNATAVLWWRQLGASTWKPGVDLAIDRERRRMWGSIWPLDQGTAVEVRLDVQDPSPVGEPLVAQTRTRRLQLTTQGGRAIYVHPNAGNDVNPGTREAPYKTLKKALSGVAAGDTVYAMTGLYSESIYLEYVKGTEEKPIVITAAPGHKPVLDGSQAIRPAAAWTVEEPGLFSIGGNYPEEGPGYVAQDGRRMYPYPSLDALRADEFGNKRAWYFDPAKRRLYVRPGDGKAAGAHTYAVSIHDYGIYLEGCRNFVISGFEVRYYGRACLRVSGPKATGNVIYGNTVHGSQNGIFVKSTGTENTAVWNNIVSEPGLPDFTWASIKASPYGRQGIIFFNSGRGQSICHNKVRDWFDCIDVESWLHPDELELHRDTDVMFNECWNAGDDAFELDGGGVNMRVHGNRIRNAHSAISLAPVERGPVYVTRNDATFHTLFLKLSVGSPSPGWTYMYHNSGYTMDNSNEATMIRFNVYEEVDRNRVMINNALVGSEFAVHRGRPNHRLDYNCYYHTPNIGPRKFEWQGQPYTSIEAFRSASGQEQHGLYADPMFRSTPDLAQFGSGLYPLYDDVSVGDMHPAPGSPLIDAGAVIRGVSDTFAGTAPDIGAFESEP